MDFNIPKDIQTFKTEYFGKVKTKSFTLYKPVIKPKVDLISKFVDLLTKSKKPIFYVGGGVTTLVSWTLLSTRLINSI